MKEGLADDIFSILLNVLFSFMNMQNHRLMRSRNKNKDSSSEDLINL